MPYPSCRSSHPRCEPRPFPPRRGSGGGQTGRIRPGEGQRRRIPAAFYWHPCRESASVGLPARTARSCRHRTARFRHAHRPLSARYPAEHGNRVAAVRVPGDRGSHHRAGRISDHRPRLPPCRHGLSRCRDDRTARVMEGFRGLAARRGCRLVLFTTGAAMSYLDHQPGGPTCCCSAANPRVYRQRCMQPPTPASSFQCGPACVRSMSRWPPPSPLAKRCGRPAERLKPPAAGTATPLRFPARNREDRHRDMTTRVFTLALGVIPEGRLACRAFF